MKVTLVDKMGTDLTVVNAARVSYAKTKAKFDDKDEKLIKFLAEHNHWSPFAHASLQFRIQAPLFVARQLVKHQVGLSWNEVSRRYVNYTPELYDIDVWRGKPVDSKQGSGGEIQLTDAMQVMARNGKLFSWAFEGKRYDIGTMKDWFQSHIELSLTSDFSPIIKSVVKEL